MEIEENIKSFRLGVVRKVLVKVCSLEELDLDNPYGGMGHFQEIVDFRKIITFLSLRGDA